MDTSELTKDRTRWWTFLVPAYNLPSRANMLFTSIATLVSFVSLVAFVLRFLRRNSIRNIRGPHVSSRLLGFEYDIGRQDEAGGLETKWAREYGPTWRVTGSFGSDVLMTADPKALQHIYHKSAYNYAKQTAQNHMGYIMSGPNIVWAQGQVHQRHRKLMNPAFSTAQLRSFLPLFQSVTYKVVDKWKSDLSSKKDMDLFVNQWLSRAALDIIGAAAFDYDYKALDDADESALAKAYHGILKDINFRLPEVEILFRAAWDYLPFPILKLFAYTPTKTFNRVRYVRNLYNAYGRKILREKSADVDAEKRSHGKDILSILIRANDSSDEKTKLTEDEILAQMYTLTLAGHETTASTVSFLLYELAKHPEYQDRMRREIMEARGRVAARGDAGFTAEDLDGMTLCLNAIKETLRLHPVVTHLPRVATKDDVIPLAFPIVTASGEAIHEVPVAKGQVINTSMLVYNRLPQVWGADADAWNPDRFSRLDDHKQTYVGVFANLLIEMQVFVAEFVGAFQFSLPDGAADEIQCAPAGNIMVPIVRGKPDLGTALRLRVSLVN
ncbi:hypothetical protein ACG7TL_004426 [Trametes sanguinea]